MKRLISIFLLAIMALFMTDTLTELHAAAAEQSESSGVAVSVSSDKKTYAAAEDADISFTIRNLNDADLNGVSWKLQLPEDLSAFSGSLYGENLRIRAGESYDGSVSVGIAGPEPTEAVTEAAGTTTAQGTTAAQGVNAGEQATAIGLICVIAAAAALAWITRKRSSKLSGIFCVLFCAGLIAVSSPAGISAAEGAAAEIQVDHTVTIGGTEYTIALRVSVDEISEAITPSRLYAWAKYNKADNALCIRWLAQDDAVSYQVFEKQDAGQPLATVTEQDEFVYPVGTSDAKAKYVFYVEAEKEDGQKAVSNNVTVRRNSDGSYTFSDIDSDRDGLDDLDEIEWGASRLDPDTDQDGLTDGFEVYQSGTDPISTDTDENGIPDGSEDFDGDGIPTKQEHECRANPYFADSDEDGFPDSYELNNGMDPANADPIAIDGEAAAKLKDYAVTDLEALNENEAYPLEIFYNDDQYIEQINGIYTDEKIQNAQEALYSLYHIRSLLGIEDPAAELEFIKTVFSPQTVSYTFGMQYKGIEVEGRSITLTCKTDGTISSLFSGYVNGSHFEKLNTEPTVTKQRLTEIVRSGSDKSARILACDLCIRMEQDAVLTYRVRTSADRAFWIDAHTGKILYETDVMSAWTVVEAKDELGTTRRIMTLHEEEGKTDTYYLRDLLKKVGVYQYDSYGGTEGISELYRWNDKPDVLEGSGWRSYFPAYHQSAVRSNKHQSAVPDPGAWDGQAVSAYYNILQVWNRYASKQYYGLNGKGGATPVYVRATSTFVRVDSNGNIIEPDANACYSPSDELFFTDECERATSLTNNLDIIGHEFGHAVVNHRKGQKSGYFSTFSTFFMNMVDESYGDVFGSWAQGSWMVYPRNAAFPTLTENPEIVGGEHYKAPEEDTHRNATIISHAAYLLNTKYQYSLEDIFDLFYGSVPSLTDSLTKYEHIRNVLIASARAQGYSAEKVYHIYDAFEAVGVPIPVGSAKIIVKEGSKVLEHASVTLSNYGSRKIALTNANGSIVFENLQIGTYQVQIDVKGKTPVCTTILVTEEQRTVRIVDVLFAGTEYDWECYDHYDFQQHFGPTLSQHIEFNENDIKMRGYTEVNFKDFLLTHENDNPDSFVHSAGKILSFRLERDKADWHTLEGAGFLFDVTVTKPEENTDNPDSTDGSNAESGDGTGEETVKTDVAGSDGFLTAHCVLVTCYGMKLYYLKDVDIALFRNGQLGSIDQIGTMLGEEIYDIGDVMEAHSISINIRKGQRETISILDNGKLIVKNLEIKTLDGDDYGPITSHDSHWCTQESWFTFSDILMSNVK